MEPNAFTAKDLLESLAHRVKACASVLPGLPPTPRETWLDHAETLIEHAELGWHDTYHWSSRQHEALKLGGLTGRLSLRGAVLERIWPWLWLGQWLHLGSSTTIGLGRYVLNAH